MLASGWLKAQEATAPKSSEARRLFRRRDARELRRRFAAVDREVAAEAARRALADAHALATRRCLVDTVTCEPAFPVSGQAEVRLHCTKGGDLVLRDVPVTQVQPVADAWRDGTLRITAAARPGALFVVELRDSRATYQLVGSRLTCEATPRAS